MKLSSWIVLHPLSFFVFLALIVLVLPSLAIPYWYNMLKQMERNVHFNSKTFHLALRSHIEDTSKLLLPIRSSASNFARSLNSSLSAQNRSSSPTIQHTVAPMLYQGFSILPHITQISYVGFDGLFFSYYTEGNRTLATYFDSTIPFSANASRHLVRTRSVDPDTGKLHDDGDAELKHSTMTNTSWFREALNATRAQVSLGNGWKPSAEDHLLFLYTSPLTAGKGALSMGFAVKTFTDLFSSIDLHGGSLYLATKDGEVLKDGRLPNTRLVALSSGSITFRVVNNGGRISYARNVSCHLESESSTFKTGEIDYMVNCSPIEIMGKHLVYVLVFPCKGLLNVVEKDGKLTLILLMSTILTMVISIFVFVLLIARAARREMYLCAALIKQMESTQQAERKSMNKSLAFASASHDVRASLAGISGLIEICYDGIHPGSELETNLAQMETCTKDLLGILNSILDTSKIEAGKMQLEEEEFNLAQLVEDVVDLYHPVGVKKGVDVVFDPYYGSLPKVSQVKGDPGKLKQILCNLLSNAIKFTSEGHVSVRVWAQKPSFTNSILATERHGSLNCLSFLFYKNSDSGEDLEASNAFQKNSNVMEFVIEVDDTGRGIPKEKQKSVFENFVQVKETALGEGGTGLGLGIVQSMVRLMGGEIGIIDKEFGEKGTCFRFNIFLPTCDGVSTEIAREEFISDSVSSDSRQHTGASALLSPKLELSHVVLLIQSEERRRIAKKFMEDQGLKVKVVKKWENLSSNLQRIDNKMNLSHHTNSSGKSSPSSSFSPRPKDEPLSTMDGSDHVLRVYRKNNMRSVSCILILIDVSVGPFTELWRTVADFRKDLSNGCCKVVWLDKQTKCIRGVEEDKLAPNDHIMTKPLHGSRLFEAIRLLPEFGGSHQAAESSSAPSSETHAQSKLGDFSAHRETQMVVEIQEQVEPSSKKPLTGKKILVVEDNAVFRKLITSILTRIGAVVELCENGEEGLELVCKCLRDKRKHEASNVFTFDYIFMDCEMPKMDGYKATRRIREEEKHYGIHIPIIALTAHDTNGEEASKMVRAGMDFYLTKPPKIDQLLKAIQYIHNQ